MRPIKEISKEIREDWKNISPAAAPYLEAMDTLETPDQEYGCERADGIILYFLSNAQGWRGETARRIKEELKQLSNIKN